MRFGLGHHQLRRLINVVVGPIPVDHHAVDATADHVGNLIVDLRRVGRAITDVHVL